MNDPTRQSDQEHTSGSSAGDSWIASYLGVMMPEVIPASILGLGSPVWLVHLVLVHEFLAALALAVGVSLSGIVLTYALRKKSTALLHGCVLLLVLTGAATMWLLHEM